MRSFSIGALYSGFCLDIGTIVMAVITCVCGMFLIKDQRQVAQKLPALHDYQINSAHTPGRGTCHQHNGNHSPALVTCIIIATPMIDSKRRCREGGGGRSNVGDIIFSCVTTHMVLSRHVCNSTLALAFVDSVTRVLRVQSLV